MQQPLCDDPSEAFEQGVEARAAGQPASSNPYAPGTDERTEWDAGWHATLDLDEEADPRSDRIQADDE